MLRLTSIICGITLVAYLVAQTVFSIHENHRAFWAIVGGDTRARSRYYFEVVFSECVTAILALAALQFDLARLNPSHLHIGDTAFGKWCAWAASHFATGVSTMFTHRGGLVLIVVIFRLWQARHRANRVPQDALPPPSSVRRIPLSLLLPTTPRERVTFALLALSAGICEEIVFRGWLMDALHGVVRLTGAALILTAALIFGLAHYVQGPLEMLITGLIGLALSGLYIATGSLLVPIIVHALIDLRFALFPSLCFTTEEIPRPSQ